jgi:hypothetical protein
MFDKVRVHVLDGVDQDVRRFHPAMQMVYNLKPINRYS